jgi:hypothetical protein
MARYFFDIVDRNCCSSYDYTGRETQSPQNARDLAEVIALDLCCTDPDTWTGCTVEVRDRLGARLFSVPVPANACC